MFPFSAEWSMPYGFHSKVLKLPISLPFIHTFSSLLIALDGHMRSMSERYDDISRTALVSFSHSNNFEGFVPAIAQPTVHYCLQHMLYTRGWDFYAHVKPAFNATRCDLSLGIFTLYLKLPLEQIAFCWVITLFGC